MPKDTLRKAGDTTNGGHDQVRDGTVTGTAAKGYGQHAADGSEYDKYGNRIDYSQLTATNFK